MPLSLFIKVGRMDTVKDALTALNTESETGEEIKESSS